jgi:competence protein ComGC
MKQKTMRKPLAITFIEVLLIITALLVLAAMLLPALAKAKMKSSRISCMNNLKQIGIAYRLWANDNGDLFPSQQSVKYGGWADLLTNANQGANCWTNYFILQNELGESCKLVICSYDERQPASSFDSGFDNTHISYFVGVNANDLFPQSPLCGDRNLGPGPKPDPDYGYSPTNGKGNDVIIPISGSVSWSLKMHSAGNTAGLGNMLLGDGSGQQTSSALNKTWLLNAQGTNNWPAGHIPATPSIRLVFP